MFIWRERVILYHITKTFTGRKRVIFFTWRERVKVFIWRVKVFIWRERVKYLLTLGTHAQQGLQYLGLCMCVSICLSVRPLVNISLHE